MKTPRSDLWRGERFTNKAREVAYVTRGVSDYFGSACGDRSFTATWKPMAESPGATDLQSKRVLFDTSLIVGQQAPFDGSFVDRLIGVAAHESGHVTINHTFSERKVYNPLQAMIRNIVEDFAIDFAPMATFNRGLGELTRQHRDELHDQQAEVIGKIWRSKPGRLTPIELVKLYACARIMKCTDVLTVIPSRSLELATIAELEEPSDSVIGSTLAINDPAFEFVLINAERAIIITMIAYDTVQRQEELDNEAKRDAEEQAAQEQTEQDESDASGEDESGDPDDGEESDASEDSMPEQSEDGSPSDAPSTDDSSDASESESGEESEDSDEEPASARSAASDCESDASEPANKPSESGSSGDGSGDAGEDADESDEWDDTEIPEPCASKPSDESDQDSESAKFWSEVKRESESIDARRFAENGSKNAARTLAAFVDKKIVAKTAQAYAELASEPSRQRRHDTGRIDRGRLAYATRRDDVFTQQNDRELDGTLALVIDLSGSMQGIDYEGSDEQLAKQAAASVYVALKSTPIDCYVYSYGKPRVVQLATPDRVVDFAQVSADGSTPSGPAIARVIEDVKPRGQSVILHVTDGTPDNPDLLIEEIKNARAAGWIVVNVLVGAYVRADNPWLKTLTTASNACVRLASYDKLPTCIGEAIGEIVKRGRSRL